MAYLDRVFENASETVTIPNPVVFSSTVVVADTVTFQGGMSVGTALIPDDNDGATLGTTSLKWSDLFLASGAVVNFNSGDVTVTHVATGKLAVASSWIVAAAAGEMLSATLTTNVSLGSYANAFFAKVDCQSVGGATGLLSAGCFEIMSPTTGIAGTTAGIEIEMGYGATCGALQKPCFMYLSTYGTAATDFDTYGDVFKIQGVTAATGKVVGAGTSTLRIGTGALAATKRYIPLSTAGDSFTTAYPIVTSYGTTAISIGACTTGISLSGAVTTDISFSSGATAKCTTNTLTIEEATLTFTGGTAINLDGPTTVTGILTVDTAASPANGILISATTPTDGLEISSACGSHAINISGAQTGAGITIASTCGTYGLNIAGACTTAGIALGGANATSIAISGANTSTSMLISGTWGSSSNYGAITLAGDAAGTALALGASATSFIGMRIDLTAAVTAGNDFMAIHSELETSGAMADGFILGMYQRVRIAHVAYENYAIWGRMDVNVAQTGDTGNQYLGVFGSVSFAAGAHALLATGGGYGVLGTASIASGGTLDQPLIAGYFDCNAVDNVAGVTLAVRARMQNYTDYGVEVFCQTSNATAGFHVRATAAAALPVGILFTGENVGGQGSITKALKFAAATNCGIAANTTTLTLTETSHHMIVDIAGTDYYIPIFDAANWA